MGTRERPADRGRRRTREAFQRLGLEHRQARIGSGLSLRDVAAASGTSHQQIMRFERGDVDRVSVAAIGSCCAVVGLDLSLRAYPAGDPIRDAAHARLLARFKARLHPRLRWSTEVPLPRPGELRAWDAIIAGPGWRTAVEAETAINDVQALERKLTLKTRDGGADHVLLLVADTRRNRRAMGTAPAAFVGLPLRNRDVLRDLGAGRQPAGSGLVIL